MWEKRARELIGYAEKHRRGFTHQQACRDLGWDHQTFRHALPIARRILAAEENNLPCMPDEESKPWKYRLTNIYEQSRWWLVNRFKDTQSRLRSMVAVSHSLMLATDARSLEGREAKAVYRALTRLDEDIAELREREFFAVEENSAT